MMRTLLVQLGAIGDVVTAASTARALAMDRAREVVWCVSPTAREIVERIDPGIGIIDYPGVEIRKRYLLGAPIETLWPVSSDFVENLVGFDETVNLHNTLLSSLIAGLASPGRSRGLIFGLEAPHASDPWTDLFMSSAKDGFPVHLPAPERYRLQAGISPTSPPILSLSVEGTDEIAVQPGSGWFSKALPAGLAAGIADLIESEGLGDPILLGAPSERDYLDGIDARRRSLSGERHSARCSATLADSLMVIAGSRAIVTSDTWALHAAAALSIPAVFLLGPTRIFPVGKSPAIGISPATGPPPSWLPNDPHEPMRRISPDAVIRALKEILGGPRAEPLEGLTYWRRMGDDPFDPFVSSERIDHGCDHTAMAWFGLARLDGWIRALAETAPMEPSPRPDTARLAEAISLTYGPPDAGIMDAIGAMMRERDAYSVFDTTIRSLGMERTDAREFADCWMDRTERFISRYR